MARLKSQTVRQWQRIAAVVLVVGCLLVSGVAFAGTPVLYNYDPNSHSVEVYETHLILWHDDPGLGFDFFYVDQATVGETVFDRWLAVMLTAISLGKPFDISYDPDQDGKILSMYAPR